MDPTAISASVAQMLAEEAHARLSPSGSKKWFACPGSITLEAPIPNKHTTYSDDGTAMHSVAAWCLTEHHPASKRIGDYVVVSARDEPERRVRITEDMADLVQGYVDRVRHLGIGNMLLIEQRVEFSEFVDVPEQFGTLDACVVDYAQGEIDFVDLKTGHTPVDVVKNSQLMLYALGALKLLRDRDLAANDQAFAEEADCDLA